MENKCKTNHNMFCLVFSVSSLTCEVLILHMWEVFMDISLLLRAEAVLGADLSVLLKGRVHRKNENTVYIYSLILMSMISLVKFL